VKLNRVYAIGVHSVKDAFRCNCPTKLLGMSDTITDAEFVYQVLKGFGLRR